MMHDLQELVVSWWQRDRIRVRPSEGRLFRLRPGAVLCISRTPASLSLSAQIVARQHQLHVGQPQIRYACRAGQGEGELIVTCDGERAPTIQWSSGGNDWDLNADDIEVFQG